MLYERLEGDRVQCHVCCHHCVIKKNSRGICGVRENKKGVLYALNYPKAVSAGIDPIEKKPLFHFLPRTRNYSFAALGCNFRCPWCQNYEVARAEKARRVREVDVPPKTHVENARRHACQSIAYTYSEPTVFIEYAYETMQLAHEAGIKNVWVTNGYMSEAALETILPYLDAANVDLKAVFENISKKWCGAHAQSVLETIRRMKEAGVHLEVTTLVIPGVNDSPEHLEAMVETLYDAVGGDVPWHISRFFPAFRMKDTPSTPIETLKRLRRMALNQGFTTVHLGNVR